MFYWSGPGDCLDPRERNPMAIYIRHECAVADCGAQLVNDDKLKRYVHVNVSPEREPHKPVVRVVKMQEVAA